MKNEIKKNTYGNFNLGKTEAPKSNTAQDKPKATVTKGNDLRIGKK